MIGFNKQIAMNAVSEITKFGYYRFEKAFSNSEIENFKNELNKIKQNDIPPDESTIPYLNKNHEVVYSLEWKSPVFLRALLDHPDISNVLKYFLNDTWYRQIPQDLPNYILRAMIARSGGNCLLPLHIDSFIPGNGSYVFMMQAAVILEDQNIENGCTFCVPGSHRSDRYADNENDLTKVVPIESFAGDVILWDSRLHHGAFPNKSKLSRWSIIATFSRWWIKQNYQTHQNLTENFKKGLTEKEKIVLGLCCIPPINSSERIDIKAGREIL